MEEIKVSTNEELLQLLDQLLESGNEDRWNRFYANRAKPIPFFVNAPDESLEQWVRDGLISPGHCLDLGCGNGRNVRFLARNRFVVEGNDFSSKAIEWAQENSDLEFPNLKFMCRSIFDVEFVAKSIDFVYDSGLFHHIAPHRRQKYVD